MHSGKVCKSTCESRKAYIVKGKFKDSTDPGGVAYRSTCQCFMYNVSDNVGRVCVYQSAHQAPCIDMLPMWFCKLGIENAKSREKWEKCRESGHRGYITLKPDWAFCLGICMHESCCCLSPPMCVCVCVCVCARACVRRCVLMSVCMHVWTRGLGYRIWVSLVVGKWR
jgi:hypothetical protein